MELANQNAGHCFLVINQFVDKLAKFNKKLLHVDIDKYNKQW